MLQNHVKLLFLICVITSDSMYLSFTTIHYVKNSKDLQDIHVHSCKKRIIGSPAKAKTGS